MVWLYGSILKGLDIVIEYFMQNTQLKLHIVGPIDPDFKDYFQPRTKKYTNIIWYGFLHTYSEEFMNIAYKASLIYFLLEVKDAQDLLLH